MSASHRRIAGAICTALLASGALAGCSSAAGAGAAPKVDDLVFVVAGAAGTSALDADLVDHVLADVDVTGDHVVVVRADGDPSVVMDVTIPDLPGNSGDRDEWLARTRTQLATGILAVRAVAPEVDYTEAIALAAEAFRRGASRSLVIQGSGLQTTGALSMLEGRLYAEPSDLIAHVQDTGEIPDLSGVRVRMPLGVVTDPQPALTAQARRALTTTWAAYFAAAQADEVDLSAASLTPRAHEGVALPYVTPVPIERPVPEPVAGCSQRLGSATIGFAAGSFELADPEGTRALLAESVAALADCSGAYVVQASASAEGGAAANTVLTEKRAHAVAEELSGVSGVPVADMTVIGWGEGWPCRMPDLDASGRLILDAAISNRVVVIGKGQSGC